MAIVKSSWTAQPVPHDGALPAGEWAGAGKMDIPGGKLMVKNDAEWIYLALDLVNDLGNDAGTGDYFWLVIDADANAAITVRRDYMYGLFPGSPNKLGRWYMAGPNTTFPTSSAEVLQSSVKVGFGATPASATPHRTWELKLSLAEMGITIDPTAPPPSVRFGVRVASTSPAFVQETPPSPLSAFDQFHTMVLATPASSIQYPAGTAGAVIGGVGWIPADRIAADGYATITDPYRIKPDEAAFAGTMDLIGNSSTIAALWAAGARRYRVMHRFGNTIAQVEAAPWTPIRGAWANYRWTATGYVYESFGPAANDTYPLPSPAVDYAIKSLLFQWDSSKEPNNLHQFKIEFFNGATPPVPVAAPVQVVTVRLDNQLPEVKLVDMKHDGVSIPACSIVNLGDAGDGVQVVVKAFDPEGHLLSYHVGAEWGNSQSAGIFSDGYAAHRTPTHQWQGVTAETVPAPPAEWVPPETCAYLFRVTAYPRTTNGYVYPVGHVSAFRTLTLIKPAMRVFSSPVVQLVAESMPFGFGSQGAPLAAGVETSK